MPSLPASLEFSSSHPKAAMAYLKAVQDIYNIETINNIKLIKFNNQENQATSSSQ
jgi:hypothetical protein